MKLLIFRQNLILPSRHSKNSRLHLSTKNVFLIMAHAGVIGSNVPEGNHVSIIVDNAFAYDDSNKTMLKWTFQIHKEHPLTRVINITCREASWLAATITKKH